MADITCLSVIQLPLSSNSNTGETVKPPRLHSELICYIISHVSIIPVPFVGTRTILSKYFLVRKLFLNHYAVPPLPTKYLLCGSPDSGHLHELLWLKATQDFHLPDIRPGNTIVGVSLYAIIIMACRLPYLHRSQVETRSYLIWRSFL